MNAIIEQAKQDGTIGVLRHAHGEYIIARDMGRTHEQAFSTIQRSYYITAEQFAAMMAEFGEYQPA